MQARLRQAGESIEERRRIRGQALDELASRTRRLPIESVPTGEERLCDRDSVGEIALG